MQQAFNSALPKQISVFNADGKLSNEAAQACLFLNIDFESMFPK
jgi:hypothetical protein